MTDLNENAGAGVAAPYTGTDKTPWEESVMTTLAIERKHWFHPHWCNWDRCEIDNLGGTLHDIYHHSDDMEVNYGTGGEVLKINTTLVINIDGNLTPGEEPIEGRVGAFGYSLTVEEAEELALALTQAAWEAKCSVRALTDREPTQAVVEAELEDYDGGYVDVLNVTTELIDQWGPVTTADDLIEKVPANEWWAIVRKHTKAAAR